MCSTTTTTTLGGLPVNISDEDEEEQLPSSAEDEELDELVTAGRLFLLPDAFTPQVWANRNVRTVLI